MSIEITLFIIANALLVGGIISMCFPDQISDIQKQIYPSWCLPPFMNKPNILRCYGALCAIVGAVFATILIVRL